MRDITVTVNGIAHRHAVEPRLLLSDFLRHTLGLTGTHVGCEHGVCGACTVLLDGDSVRACLMFAVQADGCRVETVEGLGRIGELNALQEAFHAHHALQCGFCTPGMLMTATDLLKKYPLATDDEIREGLSGNLCRCTGYEHIVRRSAPCKDAHMKMHVLSGGRVRMRKSVYLPAAERSEMIELPVSCFLLRHPQGNVLFDTGCHPSVAEDPAARWGGMAKFMTPIMPPGENVLAGLAGIGFSADDIDVVVCSHLHPDHCGCNAFFKRATVMVHEKEIAAARGPNAEAVGYLAAEWDFGAFDALSGQRDVFGDGRIVLLPLPGHTPGSTGALVQLERSGTFLLAADAVALRVTLDRGIVPRNTQDVDAAAEVVRRGEADRGGRRHHPLRPRRRAMGDAAQGCGLL